MKPICFALLLLTMTPLAAAADTITSAEDLVPGSTAAEYLIPSREHAALAVALADEHDALAGQACAATIEGLRLSQPAIYQPVVFHDGAAEPTGGIWTYRAWITRCDRTDTYNFGFQASAGGNALLRLLVGETLTDPVLQFDVLKLFSAMAMTRVDGLNSSEMATCAALLVTDTKVSQPFHPVAEDGKRYTRWRELWTAKLCDHIVQLPLLFQTAEDGSGTTFRVDDKG